MLLFHQGWIIVTPYIHLQLVQNAAARRLTNTRRSEHISPVLASLHGSAPPYICKLLRPHEPKRSLRSSGRGLLTALKSKVATKGDRAFSVRAPKLWNSLPDDLRVGGCMLVLNCCCSALCNHSFEKFSTNKVYYYY